MADLVAAVSSVAEIGRLLGRCICAAAVIGPIGAASDITEHGRLLQFQHTLDSLGLPYKVRRLN